MSLIRELIFHIHTKPIQLLLILTLIITSKEARTQTPVYDYNDYVNASIEIGKWLSHSLTHYDYLSATPLSLPRAGAVFHTREKAAQFASDYGYSFSESKISQNIRTSYLVFKDFSSDIPSSFLIHRGHINYGLGNSTDLTFSFMQVLDSDITGLGIGLKHLFWNYNMFNIAGNGKYSSIESQALFSIKQFTLDLSASAYLYFIDLYFGLRHTSGIIDFKSSSQIQKLPRVEYLSDLNEITTFYGLTGRITTNFRLTIEVANFPKEPIISTKVTFKFNRIFPNFDIGWFRDPRLIDAK